MEKVTEQLADFVSKVGFEDLPPEVVVETKRFLLDTVGCAVAGLSVDKGKVAVKFAKAMGGTPQAAIWGTSDRVSVKDASFANGELINAMDWEDQTTPGAHISGNVIPASFALAEYVAASGKDLILAVAIAHEICCRLASALSGSKEYVAKGPEKGKTIYAEVSGMGYHVLGGAAGAAKMLGLDPNQIAACMGVAGHLSPVPSSMKFYTTKPVAATKYGSRGWTSATEVASALLVQMGYAGDTTVLDGEHGFWKFSGSTKWQPEKLFDKLGKEWRSVNTGYKIYPCCRLIHASVDCFNKILEEKRLAPEDIDKVTVWLDPFAIERQATINMNKEITTHLDAQFSFPYVMSVVAHRVNFMDWQDLSSIRDTKIIQFMDKVTFMAYPDYGRIVVDDPQKRWSSRVEVLAGGGRFVEESILPKGDHSNKLTRLSDEELAEKFRNCSSRALVREKTEEASRTILELEKVAVISDLVKKLTP